MKVYDWTIDNRLIKITDTETSKEYAYDYQGARILRWVENGMRRRYFFNGLTEEVVKHSVAGAHNAEAFGLSLQEDGESASEWYIYDNDPPEASISSVQDNDRRSKVIQCEGQSGNAFVVGDRFDINPNDDAWDETKRVLSFWYKGGFSTLVVYLSCSGGQHRLVYHASAGTDYFDSDTNQVHLYLGTAASSSAWQRFERNIEEDWEAYAPTTWQNTDGFIVRPDSTLSYDIYFDDIRFSDSTTAQFNALTGGSIGQIAAEYALGDFPSQAVKWLRPAVCLGDATPMVAAALAPLHSGQVFLPRADLSDFYDFRDSLPEAFIRLETVLRALPLTFPILLLYLRLPNFWGLL